MGVNDPLQTQELKDQKYNQNGMLHGKLNGDSSNTARRPDVTTQKVARTLRVVFPLLVFCVACNCLVISVVVHLGSGIRYLHHNIKSSGIENYERLQESEKLRGEVSLLTTKLQRITGATDSSQDADLLDPMSIQIIESATTSSYLHSTETSTALNMASDSRSDSFDGDSVRDKILKCLSQVEYLEYGRATLEKSYNLLREQMSRRLRSIEENIRQRSTGSFGNTMAFSVTKPKGTKLDRPENASKLVRFRHAILSDGSAYETSTGAFTTTSPGIYFFDAALVNSRIAGRCVANLRRNGQTLRQSSSSRSCSGDEDNCYEILATTLVTRLSRNDVVDVYISGRCDLSPKSYFQGFLLHT